LDQAIGAAPVSTVDVDQVVAKGRRRGLRRRLAVAGAASGSLVAIGVVAALVLTSGSPNTPAPGRPQQAAAAKTGAAPAHAGETPAQTKQRLEAALTAGLTAALPGVGITDGPTGGSGVRVYVPNSNTAPYDTDTVIATAAGQSEVFFQSFTGGQPQAVAAPSQGRMPANGPVLISWVTACADLSPNNPINVDGKELVDECVDSTGPDGQQIVTITQRCTGCAGQPVERIDVYVTWTNARVGLSVARDLKRDGENNPATSPLLSSAQLIAIAVSPDLTRTA
jgi:hypothetical protein